MTRIACESHPTLRILFRMSNNMESLCKSTRCTNCGKKKRPITDIIPMEDSEMWEMIDDLWSPLDPLSGKRAFHQVPSAATGLKSNVIVVELDATNDGSPNPPASIANPLRTKQQAATRKVVDRRANVFRSRFMQNFVRGMASAFGGGLVPTTEAVTYSRTRLDDVEFGDSTASRSLLQSLWPSSSRFRPFLAHFGRQSSAVPSERCPLARDYENLTPLRLPMPMTLQPQTFYW